MLLALASRLQAPSVRCSQFGAAWREPCRYISHNRRNREAARRASERKTKANGSTEEPNSLVTANTSNAEDTTKDRDAKLPSPRQNRLSLLEELFPEDAQSRDEQRVQREIPRLAFDVPESTPSQRVQKADEQYSPQARRLYDKMKAQGEQSAILVLRNASKSLIEEDFRRLIPK